MPAEAVFRLTVSVYVSPALSIRRRDVYGPRTSPGWENYPLQEVLRTVTAPDIEIYIDSDRTCYMYGEMWQGAAKDCHSAVFIAVGTGIGAGIIIDGHVLHGASDIIGATGWMALQPPYKEEYDACGCFEYYASGNGIGARVRDAVRANKAYKGRLRQKPICRISAYDVFSAYNEEDPIAVSVLHKAIEMWGMASANFCQPAESAKDNLGWRCIRPCRYLHR